MQTNETLVTIENNSLKTLADIEKSYILGILDRFRGNKNRAAKVLGIGRATLYRKLKEYGKTV